MKSLEDRLYKLRIENKLTQEEVASAINVSRQTISNWEKGTAKPSLDKAVELAEIYGISLDAMVGKTPSSVKKVSSVLKDYQGFRGTLVMCAMESQPFYPQMIHKDVEIIAVEPTSLKIRIHKKDVTEHLVFIKDVLAFMKEV